MGSQGRRLPRGATNARLLPPPSSREEKRRPKEPVPAARTHHTHHSPHPLHSLGPGRPSQGQPRPAPRRWTHGRFVRYDRRVYRGWVVDLVKRLPAGALSRAWGQLVRCRRPRPLVGVAKRLFVAMSGANLAEANEPINSYDSLEALFVRRLRPGLRPIVPAPDAVVSPVDGTVGACGAVAQGTLLQVKGRAYSLAKLLADAETAARFEGGPYATLYLAPHNYHRVHAPLAGEVRNATVVPGRLLPVFAEAVARIDELFARNERLITYLDTPSAGCLAVVKVGATLVGRIGVVYDETARTNIAYSSQMRRLHYDPAHPIGKGEELGVFEFGSTVVLVGEPGRVLFDAIALGEPVRVGQRLGTVQPPFVQPPTTPARRTPRKGAGKSSSSPKPRARRPTKGNGR